MQRWSSCSRVSEAYSDLGGTVDTEMHLPTYDPLSRAAQRERFRLRTAQNAVHAIPLLLLLCAIILWFFSTPDYRI